MKRKNFDKRMKRQYGRLLQFNKKIIIITKVLFLFLNTTAIVGQNININSNGNGYYFELAVANQAMSCILKGCFDGLKRTKFIDENTDSDENRIKWRIDSVNNHVNSRPFFRTDFHYDAFLPPLVFYTTFYRTLDNSIFFQIKIELIYKSGLLSAKSIKLIDKDFVLTPINRPTYKYPDQGSKTNTLSPPPPMESEEEIYWHRGLNLCSDCTQKKTIIVDQNKQFWFKEKHKYELIQTYDDDLYKVKKNGLWGTVNYENEEIIPILYDKIDIITNKLTSMVFKEGKTGIYYQNVMVIPVEYEEIKPFYAYDGKNQPAFIAKKDNLYGFLDGKGKVIIPTEYEEIALFYSKYLKLKKKGLYGVAKVNGDMLYEPIFKEIDFEPMLFHGIMKTTNKKDRKKLFALVEENGKTTLRRLKNK